MIVTVDRKPVLSKLFEALNNDEEREVIDTMDDEEMLMLALIVKHALTPAGRFALAYYHGLVDGKKHTHAQTVSMCNIDPMGFSTLKLKFSRQARATLAKHPTLERLLRP
jgi:hypothetical protein